MLKTMAGLVRGSGSRTSRSKRFLVAEALQASMNKDLARVFVRKVLPTRWADDTLLRHEDLQEYFYTMANNARMALFASLETDTFDRLTWEFLATFEDTLVSHQRN